MVVDQAAQPVGDPAVGGAGRTLHAALDITRAAPSDAVFVGDSITDVIAETSSELPCIGYAKQPEHAEGLADADALVVVDDTHALATALR